MLPIVAEVALALSVLNWLLFVVITFVIDFPKLLKLLDALQKLLSSMHGTDTGGGKTVETAVDIGAIAAAAGMLASAFKKAGPAPTAAAMSVLCLLVALAAAGVSRP